MVNWGDGKTTPLGALSTASTTVTHVFAAEGTYLVTATATDASGFSEPASTSVTVLPAQPPSVTVQVTPSSASVNQRVTVTVSVSGNNSSIQSFVYDFGDGSAPLPLLSPTATHAYGLPTGTKTILVTVNLANGQFGTGVGTVNIIP